MDLIKIGKSKNKGNGLFANEHIPINTTIISISDDQFITCDFLTDYYEFLNLTHNPQVKSKVLFAYFLASAQMISAKQRQDIERVQRYISGLPQTTNAMICWSETQLSHIHNQDLVRRIQNKKKLIENNFDLIHSEVKKVWERPIGFGQYRLFQHPHQVEKLTLDEVIRFYALIESRGVYYPNVSNQLDCNQALIPVIDNLNHSENPNCKVQISFLCKVTTIKEIEKGQEILVSYGAFPLSIFLENFGFLPIDQDYPQDFLNYQDERQFLAHLYNNYCHRRKNSQNYCEKQEQEKRD